MSIRDSEMHLVAVIGACVLTAALSVPAVWWASSTSGSSGKDDEIDKKLVIEASLAMKKSEKKQPQKQFKQPDEPDKPKGISRDETKIPKAQCCTSEADCNKVSLPFPTTCPDDGRCESNRCKPRKKEKPDKSDEPITKIPDRTGKVDDPTGKPTESTVGAFNGNKKGTSTINKGDPWFQTLVNDFITLVDFPAIEEASEALACLRIEKNGEISDTTLSPPTGKRSDNDGLNAKIEIAFKKLKQDRGQGKPEHAVPTHLLEQVVTQWRCILIPAQSKQQ